MAYPINKKPLDNSRIKHTKIKRFAFADGRVGGGGGVEAIHSMLGVS